LKKIGYDLYILTCLIFCGDVNELIVLFVTTGNKICIFLSNIAVNKSLHLWLYVLLIYMFDISACTLMVF